MKKFISIVVAVGLVVSLMLMMSPATLGGEAGTTLSATVDATAHWTITYHWTIDKSVTPATWNLFSGDSGTSQYTITVTKDSGTERAWVEGEVCVTNGGAVATENLAISIDLKNGVPPPNDIIATASVDVSAHPVLAPGETYCYPYSVDIPAANIHAGGTYKVTANVTITNHSGHLGDPYGPSPSATTNLPASATPVNSTIHVDDSYGSGSWTFSSSGSVSYDRTFDCTEPGSETYNNTATIRETGQSDSASVTVNNYALGVTKTAQTSFTRTYDWTIDKSADQSALTLSIGQQFQVNYSVTVDATYADSDWAAAGTITVHNPAPTAANITAVTDGVSPDIAATADFAITFPYALAAGGDLAGTYSADLPDATTRTNTATVTIQNYDYDYQGNATPSGTTTFSGTANVDFSSATITEVDECITVSDTYSGGPQGVVWCYANGVPHTFTYSRWIGPYGTCGDYTVDNTASFVTNDTGTTDSDSWRVSVHVPCAGGCTLTFGYWKTHSSYGPAPYDDTWALLANGADTTFFLSGQTYYQVLWTAPQGNAYYILAHQYIAAKLNILNGADPSAAQTAFDAATVLFQTYTPAQIAALKGKSPLRAQFISLAETLDAYNNGLIGPGHCSE
jgi:hypothetical protein